MELVLGIDLGTSYFKLVLVDRSGEVKGLGRIAVPTEEPSPGYQEVPPRSMEHALENAYDQALKQADAKPEDIQAVSYSSQANSFLLLDGDTIPLSPIILWSDRRMKEIDERIESIISHPEYMERTGIGLQGGKGFAVSKVLWYRDHYPEKWKKCARIMMISDYLTHIMTGEPAGDGGTASLLGIWQPKEMRWWDWALETLEISPKMLSSLARPGTVIGTCRGEMSARWGLSSDIPFAVGSLDHHVAGLGVGVGATADASESSGTVLACLALTFDWEPIADCCLGPHVEESLFYKLAFNNNGAEALEWYQKNYAPEMTISRLCSLASKVSPGADGLQAKFRPEDYKDLEGFIGKKSGHGIGHYVRAIMEGVGGSLHHLVNAATGSDNPESIVATGGGAKSNLWLQIKADMIGIPFTRNIVSEPGAYGASMLAARAAGWFDKVSDCAQAWVKPGERFVPKSKNRDIYADWLRVGS